MIRISGALYKLNTYPRGEKTTKQTDQQTNPTTAKVLAAFEGDGVLHNLFQQRQTMAIIFVTEIAILPVNTGALH